MFLPRYNTDRLCNKKKLLEMKFLSGPETTWYRMLTEEQIENEIPRKSELLFTFLGNTNIICIRYMKLRYFRFSGNGIFKTQN